MGRVYFGTAGGYVFCLRAADGTLVWRFNANTYFRHILQYGNVESAWPVHGSVVVKNGVVYFAAGRSSYLDGGLTFFALDAISGEVQNRLDEIAQGGYNRIIFLGSSIGRASGC